MKKTTLLAGLLLVLSFFAPVALAQDNQVGAGAVYLSEDAKETKNSAGFFVYGIRNFEKNGFKFTLMNDFFLYNDGLTPNPNDPEGRVIRNDFKVRAPLGLTTSIGGQDFKVYATGLASVANQRGVTQFSPGVGVGFQLNENTFTDYHYVPAVSGKQFQGHRVTIEHYFDLDKNEKWKTRVGVTGFAERFDPTPTNTQNVGGAVFYVGFSRVTK